MATFYVDELRVYKSGKWCHLWTDGTDEELDAFAASLGGGVSKPQTAQGKLLGRFYHYDLRMTARIRAIGRGARVMQLKHWVARHITAEKLELMKQEMRERAGVKLKVGPESPGPEQPPVVEQ